MPKVLPRKRLCPCLLAVLASAALFGSDGSYFLSGDGTQRLHTFGVEQAAVLSAGNSSVTAVSDGETFSRSAYDDDMRLVSRVTWRRDGGTGFHVVSRTADYLYEGSSGFPSSSTERDFLAGTVTRRDFSAAGKVSRERLYSVDGDSAETLLSDALCSYDGESRITERSVTTYAADGSVLTERTVFRIPGNERGGYDYYKDGALSRSVEYSSESDYTETVYFSGGHSVAASYSGGRLVEEVFFLDGKELRRNSY